MLCRCCSRLSASIGKSLMCGSTFNSPASGFSGRAKRSQKRRLNKMMVMATKVMWLCLTNRYCMVWLSLCFFSDGLYCNKHSLCVNLFQHQQIRRLIAPVGKGIAQHRVLLLRQRLRPSFHRFGFLPPRFVAGIKHRQQQTACLQ